jgi:hypothetical protein
MLHALFQNHFSLYKRERVAFSHTLVAAMRKTLEGQATYTVQSAENARER